MGKNYRNCTCLFTQTQPPSRPPEGLTKRKELTTNSSSSANTGLKIKEKYGESILLFPNSERQLVSSLLSKKKTPEDFSKVLPFSEECTDMVFFQQKNSNSITSSVWPLINSLTVDCKLEFPRMLSTQNPSIKLEPLLSNAILESARAWSPHLHTWWGLRQKRRSI